MTEIDNLIMRLQAGDVDTVLLKQAAKEIERRGKIIDALTVKLNKELSATYQIEERLTNAENRMAKLYNMIVALRTGGIN